MYIPNYIHQWKFCFSESGMVKTHFQYPLNLFTFDHNPFSFCSKFPRIHDEFYFFNT